MATLTGQTVKSSYEQLLHVDTDGGGNGSTLLPVKDGDNGTTFALKLSTTTICVDNPTTSSASQGGKLRLQCDDGAAMADTHRLGLLEFTGAEDTNSTIIIGASVAAFANGDWDSDSAGTKLKFSTTPTGSVVSLVSNMVLDGNSRISLSNNDTSATGGEDSTSGNTLFGYLAGDTLEGSSSAGYNNILIGHKAGTLASTADNNVFIGALAGSTHVTGGRNIAIGTYAMFNTDADSDSHSSVSNVFIGVQAGGGTWAGEASNHNVAIGESAMSGDLDASIGSIAIGSSALAALTDGVQNTAIGFQSMLTTEGGQNNVMMGYNAGYQVRTGESYNTVLGSLAFSGAHGSADTNHCVAIGYSALAGALEGEDGTVAVGSLALTALTTGAGNTAIGYLSGQSITGGSKNTAVGYTSMGEATGNTITGDDNTAIGNAAGFNLEGGANSNTFVGSSAGEDCTTASLCTVIGFGSEPSADDGSNQTVIGNSTTGIGDNSVALGNANVTDVYMAQDSGAAVHCGAVVHGLAAVLVTTGTLAYATHSISKLKYVTVSADAQTLTLPAVQIGAVFIIVNIAADGGALLTIDPDGNDKFLTDIAGGVGTDGNNISNTKATQNAGDFVKLVGMSADGWAITEISGVWADE